MINLFTDKQLFSGFNTFTCNREITVNGKTVKGFDFNSKGYKRWMTIEQNQAVWVILQYNWNDHQDGELSKNPPK